MIPTRLPTELYYPICARVASRADLVALATTARVLQHPAETQLHRVAHLPDRQAGLTLFTVLQTYPRFCAFIKELRVEKDLKKGEDHGDQYWKGVRNALEKLLSLEVLALHDGPDELLSGLIFKELPNMRLRVLHCAFVLDEHLLSFLKTQPSLEELSWTGTLIRLPRQRTHIGDTDHDTTDPDASLLPVLQEYFPPGTLPVLRTLRTESLAHARALVPGRPILHLWVPGVGGGCAYAAEHIHQHLLSAQQRVDPISHPEIEEIPFSLAHPVPGSTGLAVKWLKRALRDFSLGTHPRGGVQSLRVALDLPREELHDVLVTMAEALPNLRTLGYISGTAIESSQREHNSKTDDFTDALPLPHFPHLYTICSWSTPSRRAVTHLEVARAQGTLPSLSNLACLHFSPAFEWLCLPVLRPEENSAESESLGSGAHMDTQIHWQREPYSGRRRPTALHDPDNLLWRGT